MHSRWFNASVVLLWLTTMSWLVREKVLPSMLVGDPPNYNSIVAAQRDAPPVGWQMSWGHRSIGWALTQTKLLPSGVTEIQGRVHFDKLPLEEMMPEWLRKLSCVVAQPFHKLQMDMRSVLTIDALGRLTRFDSAMRVDPFDELICVRGTVEGRHLELMVRTGTASYSSEAYLPSNALMCDALSPQSQLPGLRAGQKWTVPVFSPLWPAKNPLEIIHAIVEDLEPFYWNDAVEDVWLVVYRGDVGNDSVGDKNVRGRLWVRRDGTVVQQQVMLFGSTITFVRMSDERALKLSQEATTLPWNENNEMRDMFHD